MRFKLKTRPFPTPPSTSPQVFANDLNPDSYRWLRENITLNKVAGLVHPYNLDGREFIRLAAAGALPPSQLPVDPTGGGKAGGGDKKRGKGAVVAAAGAAPLQGQDAATGVPASAAAAAPAPEADAHLLAEQAESPLFQHVVMNLPASAVEFLDAFQGAFGGARWQGHPLPLVHVYTFSKGDETLEGE
jgi:tRNA (guanine37-N1)-methyltransferase